MKQPTFTNEQEQAAFENALDCLYYGFGRSYWNACGLPEEEATQVWEEARTFLDQF